MITTQNVLEQLTGKQIVHEFRNYLEEHFESFAAVHEQYITAADALRSDLGAAVSPTIDDVADAIDRQTVSNLLFSFVLGMKSNLDHFVDPMARTVLDVDFPVFLREGTAMRLPEYVKAQETIDAFVALLTPAQKGLFEDVTEYIVFLETTGPKLAHYFGYILGNDLLYRVVPGYHQDDVLTMHYRFVLESYFSAINF